MLRRSLLLLVLVACKDDRLEVESGLPADKPGSALTDGERAQLCAAGDAYFDAQFPPEKDRAYYCVGLASSAGDGDVCQQALGECLDSTDPPPARKACSAEPQDWSMCDATVAEIEACWTENFEASGEAIEVRKPCTPWQPVELSAECEQIELRCPRFPKPPSG